MDELMQRRYAMECDSAMEANGLLLPAVVWVDLEGAVLGEVSQREIGIV